MESVKLCPKCGTMLHPITDLEIQNQTGGSSIKNALDILMSEEAVSLDQVDFVSLEKLIESNEYKELSTYNQEIVFNHIQDLLPGQKKRLKLALNSFKEKTVRDYRVYLICPMRDYITPIPNDMVIKDRYLRGSQVDNKTSAYVPCPYATHNSTLPSTRDHVCCNGKDCVALKNKQEPEFVFFRRPSGRVMHACIACSALC